MNPTLHYLLKETLLRWRNRPSSPLARLILTFTLTATAGGFLAGFTASAEALRAQLARLGFDTLVVRTATKEGAPPMANGVPENHWASPLVKEGRTTVLRQAPLLATAAWGQPLSVFIAAWPVLAELQSGANPPSTNAAVVFTRTLPAGRATHVRLANGIEIPAVTMTPTGPWRALLEGDAIMLAPELAPDGTSTSGVDVVLFTPTDPSGLPAWATAIRNLPVAVGEPAPTLQDPSPLRASLADLESAQRFWRSIILGLLGTGVILVYGAIGALEYREMRFSQALLRSFGVRGRLLWSASLCENIFIANASLLAALFAVNRLTNSILPQLPAFDHTTATLLPISACLFLALIVNAGVALSLLPLTRALRQPIGALLS